MCTYILFLVQEDCKWGTLLWTEVLIAFCSCRGSCCGILPLAKWWYSLVIQSSICLWSIKCAELSSRSFWSSARFYLLPKAQVRKLSLWTSVLAVVISSSGHVAVFNGTLSSHCGGRILPHFSSPLRETYNFWPCFQLFSCRSSNSFHS